MLSDDFYGKKQFVWWTGEVEDVNDPLKIGCVRVRIIGLHPKEKNLVPTETLPWAQVILPVNNVNCASTPRIGDWVFGFFQDGDAAQIPVVLGVFSGIDQNVNIAGKTYTQPSQDGFSGDARTQAQVNVAPRPLSHIDDRQKGQPASFKKMSRGILDGTGVKSTNTKRAKVCDITTEVNMAVGMAKGAFTQIVQAIREGIRALLKAMGFSDASGMTSSIVSYLKSIAADVKCILKFVKKIADFVKIVMKVINTIKAILKFIMSLPKRLMELLKECLSSVMSSLSAGVKDMIPSGGSSDFTQIVSEIGSISKEITTTISDSKTIISDAIDTKEAYNLEFLVDPTSLNEISSATSNLSSYITNQNEENKITVTNSIYKFNVTAEA